MSLINASLNRMTLKLLKDAIEGLEAGMSLEELTNKEFDMDSVKSRQLLKISDAGEVYKAMEFRGWIKMRTAKNPNGSLHAWSTKKVWSFTPEFFDILLTDPPRVCKTAKNIPSLELPIQAAWNKLRSLVRIVQKLEIYQC